MGEPELVDRFFAEARANDFKMHPEHVAIPGEVPIMRRPVMSRRTHGTKSASAKLSYNANVWLFGAADLYSVDDDCP